MKIKSLQKRTKIAIAAILSAALVAGIATGVYFVRRSKIVLDVYPVENLAMNWWTDTPVTDGRISKDVSQNVFLSYTDMVEELLVSTGDRVSRGTPLIQYDTTLTALQAELLELEIELKKNSIKRSEKELSDFKKNYSKQIAAVMSTDGGGTQSGGNAQSGGANVQSGGEGLEGPDLPVGGFEEPGINDTKPLLVLDQNSEPYAGKGTKAEPYRYFAVSGARIGSDFVVKRSLEVGEEPLYLLIEMREKNLFSGKPMSAVSMIFKPEGGFEFDIRLDESLAPLVTPEPEETPPVTEPPEETPPPETEPPEETPPATTPPVTTKPPVTKPPTTTQPIPSYTNDEVKLMYIEKQKELKDMKLDLEQMELDFRLVDDKLARGTVLSDIEGVVTSVLDPDTAVMSGEAVITVSGGGGYYVKGVISEFDLESVVLGQVVEVVSWRTQDICEGSIVELGTLPVSGGYYGGASASYYPFTAYVSEEYSLMEGEYVEVSFSGAEEDGESLYLERAYVREEDDGRSYVFVRDEEELLRKAYVDTGKILWGTYIEIRSGLSLEDYVAFPYGRDIREGVRTEVRDYNDYFGYMY